MPIIRESNVTFDRWKDLRSAVRKMITKGTYQSLANIHAEQVDDPDGLSWSKHRMHGAMYGPTGFRRFLPWHRAYLIVFERSLRQIDETLALPYWDWDNDQGKLVGFRDFLALSSARDLGLPAGVEATDPSHRPWFSSEALTQFFETFGGDYYFFTRTLEMGTRSSLGTIIGQHGAGHNWIGGDMANILISPNDIVFWLHHAAIDRLWSKWQMQNPNERAHLSGKDAKLDPWGSEFTVENIDEISNLGDDSYSYEDPVRPASPITTSVI